MELPGEMPRSPVRTVPPVLFTAELPRTAKFCAVPSSGAVACANAVFNEPVERSRTAANKQEKRRFLYSISGSLL